ncbi:hypothetical protein [Nostoc sp.]|uniref:hypothetical protein n=1 Tax=Nostoc sp. TaxID=1180 RepID=UPI002FF6C1A3
MIQIYGVASNKAFGLFPFSQRLQITGTGGHIMSDKGNGINGETLSPILVILVAGSISLAIVNKDNHPAYFDLVKIAMVYSFGSHKSKGKPKE